MASSCSAFTSVGLLLALGGIPSIVFHMSQVTGKANITSPEAPVLNITPERVVVDYKLDNETALNQGLSVSCTIPDSVPTSQIHNVALFFTATYGQSAGHSVLLAKFNATVPQHGRIDVVREDGAIATGGLKYRLIDYRVAKATCLNAGEYSCQLTDTQFDICTTSLTFTYRVTPEPVCTRNSLKVNYTRLVLLTGREYNLTCTASVGTMDGEKVVWVWEFQDRSKVPSRWNTITTNITTTTMGGVTTPQHCITFEQMSNLTLKPRPADPNGDYRCYVRKDGVSFDELAGVFVVHINSPIDIGLFGTTYRLWIIILIAVLAIIFIVIIFAVALRHLTRRPSKQSRRSSDFKRGAMLQYFPADPQPKRRPKRGVILKSDAESESQHSRLIFPNGLRSGHEKDRRGMRNRDRQRADYTKDCSTDIDTAPESSGRTEGEISLVEGRNDERYRQPSSKGRKISWAERQLDNIERSRRASITRQASRTSRRSFLSTATFTEAGVDTIEDAEDVSEDSGRDLVDPDVTHSPYSSGSNSRQLDEGLDDPELTASSSRHSRRPSSKENDEYQN